ncbi:unnamed protein product [Schistosoma mattheei]|uniref:Uncharacterized protein n=1 Tax=Schistosoma mattheei TaxID=31246 RepID=A0A183NLH3_9TREM|nr:unnamed protein product [Schistosoma mattheei]
MFIFLVVKIQSTQFVSVVNFFFPKLYCSTVIATIYWSKEWRNDIKSPFRHNVYHQLKPIQRRVYIATDDPSVFNETKLKYPNYIFYGNRGRANSASVFRRKNEDSIMGVVTDVFALSRTNYLVCTFSSQVCRLAYELMQSNHLELGDASQQFRSLDDIYYFGGQQASPYEVLISSTEHGLSPGDLVHFHGNHWNGYAKVEKLNTNRRLFCSCFSSFLCTTNLLIYGFIFERHRTSFFYCSVDALS